MPLPNSKIWGVFGCPLVRWVQERKSRKRVIERLQSVKSIQKQLFQASLTIARESAGRIFLWTIRSGPRLCMSYTNLIFLFDESAVIRLEVIPPNTKAY